MWSYATLAVLFLGNTAKNRPGGRGLFQFFAVRRAAGYRPPPLLHSQCGKNLRSLASIVKKFFFG
jgi:hypothetical protein